jgi:hypothetical protein
MIGFCNIAVIVWGKKKGGFSERKKGKKMKLKI